MKKALCLLAVMAVAGCTAVPTARLRSVSADGEVRESIVKLHRTGGHYEFRLPCGSLEGLDTVSITPSFARARAGDEGFFLSSQGFMTRFLPDRPDGSYAVYKNHPIALEGIQTPQGCYAAFFQAYRWCMRSRVELQDGVYTNTFDYILRNIDLTEDLAVEYWPLRGKDATYSGMGRLYRKRFVQGNPEIRPLKEKVKDRPLLKFAVDNPEIRIRQAWKPVPTPVPDQTRENEPPVRVKATFDRVCDIVDALKQAGVEGAQLTLVGWNLRGHDGRYPTVFPPEPALGGAPRLRHLIGYAQENGFQIVPHICTGDAYKVSEDWDPADVAKLPSGELDSSYVYGSGRMYKLCPEVAYKKFVQSVNDSIRAYGFRGVEYNDVYSIVPPVVCHDPHHRLNHAQAARYDRLILKDGVDKVGGIGSEGGYDHVASVLDFCLYTAMNGLTKVNAAMMRDAYVPVWHIIYNGYIYSCPFSESVNYSTKSPAVAMKIMEYGCHPTFYFHAAHRDDAKNWIGNHETDLYCATQEDLESAAAAIKQGYDYLQEYGYIQYLTLEDHQEIQPGVFRSVFSDGTKTYCNYTDQPAAVDGIDIPALDWVTLKGER